MHRIDADQSVVSFPTPQPVGTPGYFQGGDPGSGMDATVVDADWCNSVQEEIAHCVEAGGLTLSKTDNTQLWKALQMSIGRIILTAPLDLYVSTTGNDSNDGLTSGTAMKTLQAASDKIMNRYHLNGFYATVHIADGTYAPVVCVGVPAGTYNWSAAPKAAVRFVGNLATPANVIISQTSATPNYSAAFGAALGAIVNVQGVTIQALSGTGAVEGIGANQGYVSFSNCRFGPCVGAQLQATQGGMIVAQTSYSIVGNAAEHMLADSGGQIQVQGVAVTLTGSPAFSGAFAMVTHCGIIYSNGSTFTGAATGTRYAASTCGVIDTQGGGANYFPGSIAGSAPTSGGQYV